MNFETIKGYIRSGEYDEIINPDWSKGSKETKWISRRNFRDDCLEIGYSQGYPPEGVQKAYSVAYEIGHSFGWIEILYFYEETLEIVELTTKALV